MQSQLPLRPGGRARPVLRWVSLAAVAAASLLALAGCGERAHQHQFTAMSTIVRVTVYHRRALDWPEVERAVHEYAARYDHRLPASPIAQLNQTGAAELDPEVAATLATAVQIARLSNGAFDPTVLPLTRLWDFDHGGTLPTAAAIAAALARVDYRRLQVAGNHTTLRDAALDLGAIAKGAVLDHLADWLAARGYGQFLLEAGGDVLVAGLKPDDALWRIWIRHPRQSDLPLAIAVIGTAGGRVALATSGDYERSFEQDGVRYHHLLNPATGLPDSDAVSVTVISGSAVEADALATALFVLGSAGAELLATLPGLEGVIVHRAGGTLEAVVSDGFPALHGQVNVN